MIVRPRRRLAVSYSVILSAGTHVVAKASVYHADPSQNCEQDHRRQEEQAEHNPTSPRHPELSPLPAFLVLVLFFHSLLIPLLRYLGSLEVRRSLATTADRMALMVSLVHGAVGQDRAFKILGSG